MSDDDKKQPRAASLPASSELTLRDYFAAHAPVAPHWFQPTMGLPLPEYFDAPLPHGSYASVGHCLQCDEHFEQQEKHAKAHAAYRQLQTIAAATQWPYAWADAMLAERGKGR